MQSQETVYSKIQLSKNGLHQGDAAVVRDVSSWRLLSCCLILAAGRVRSKKKKTETKRTKVRRTQNTVRNPQQPRDRDHLETACDETRPTR